MRVLREVALLALVAGLLVGPAVGFADDGPIVVRGDGRGVVDSQASAPGRPASARPVVGRQPVPAVTCQYFKQYYTVSIPGGRTVDLGGRVQTPRGSGQWWLRACSDGSRDIVFIPDGADPNGAPAVTPGMLAIRAYNRMRLPLPQAAFNPARPTSAGPATTAHLQTWWWLRDWSIRQQLTAAGPVWVRVIARPVSSVWDPGDGSPSVSCAGPGQAWRPGAAGGCWSTYAASSAAQLDRVYRAAVTVVWSVSWVGSGGTAGELPELRLTTVFPVAVMERESIVISAGGVR